MVGGVDRYYQMARCLRDEDLRADRQYEFMQLDMEMSFVTQDDVLDAVSEAVLDAAEAATGERPPAIERITWHEAMDRWGIDKPDLRFGLELVELTPVFAATEFKAFAGPGSIKGIRVPGADSTAATSSTAHRPSEALGAKGLVWMKVTRRRATRAPASSRRWPSSCRPTRPAAVRSTPGGRRRRPDADRCRRVDDHLRSARHDAQRHRASAGTRRSVPLRVGRRLPAVRGRRRGPGRPKPGHHPFTTPHPDDLDKLETDPLKVRIEAYDLVLNGWELGSGSIRIHEPELQRACLQGCSASPTTRPQRKFGFFLNPFDYGALRRTEASRSVSTGSWPSSPGEENIREVIAFPKTQSGQTR
jgi:aspartyl-tRNA synthetase